MEPLDPNALPIVELARHDGDGSGDASRDSSADASGDSSGDSTIDNGGERPARAVWWYVVPTAVLVVVGLVVGIVVFNDAAGGPPTGPATASEAARQFVAAVDRGDGDSAASVSCSSFTDGARAVARAGEQGVRFTLTGVQLRAADTAVALVRERLTVGTHSDTAGDRLNVFRQGRRWLVCGQAD